MRALALRQQATPYDGGADSFKVHDTGANFSSVSFAGTYRTWAAIRQPVPAKPSNVLTFHV